MPFGDQRPLQRQLGGKDRAAGSAASSLLAPGAKPSLPETELGNPENKAGLDQPGLGFFFSRRQRIFQLFFPSSLHMAALELNVTLDGQRGFASEHPSCSQRPPYPSLIRPKY